ncbi:uncharacterized protein BDR25DRAFT_302835 [Lindgomyces ingoldianus]|uniref:Uncharacterized protein n=1 Tax=Lindgomyces ingoldianus TaxID=673940 RepID=A0ACB6R0J3_9PLEO|nr:uncharacterized protein BDR25DRAFT_302835 [Lindgomyces ingoldianus]KAF2472032.1 hypothetical protein BDR25DRAFT_302835 [Lindgomyces ingoldianus]
MSGLRLLGAGWSQVGSLTIAQRAAIHQTVATRYAGKETALGHEGRKDEIEREKDDLLKKHKEGKGHWKEQLASDSESIVKADRGEVEASKETIKELQEEGAKLAKEKK